MSPAIARKVLTLFQQNFITTKAEFIDLSVREKEILTLLVKGQSYKMIADVTFTSYHTVNSHIKRIYKKLHVNSVAEVVNKAINQRLVCLVISLFLSFF
jgi:DNA-binding NarL/FixJ family response regulator